MPLFFKGYKLEMSKISQTFNIHPPDRPQDWVIAIIECIPRDAYEYIGNGYEKDGRLNVMIVMEASRDEKQLTKSPITPSDDKTLADIARRVCTPAIWPSFDDLDSPSTFWDNWRGGAIRLLEWNGEQKSDA